MSMTVSSLIADEHREQYQREGCFMLESIATQQSIRMLLSLIFLIVCCCWWNALSAAERPNVVMILADDQSYRDFGFMGNQTVHTPHLDQLAASSARYVNGYVPMSVCRPSLATVLTGLYPHQHGIHFNHPPPGLRAMQSMTAEQYHTTRAKSDYLIRNTPSLPRILARHGYACLQTGKHWEGDFQTAGFTHGMTLGRPADRLSMITGTREQSGGEWVAHGNGDAGLIIGRETMEPIYDFVDKHAGRQPFFVWYAPFLPHTPYDAPDRFQRLYDGKGVPDHLLPYYAEISRFDETVGALLNYLQNKDLISNTLIVFASDNGLRPHLQRHERQDGRSKLSQYEDGLRTPILIRWDGHVRPAEHQPLVRTVDLVPTVLSAVGLSDEVIPRMRGLNLMPTASAGQPPPERPAFGAIYPNDAVSLGQPSRHVRGRWVRDGDFKLIVPGPAAPGLSLALFNLASDPEERSNLATDPAQSERIAKLQNLLDKWWPATDDNDVTQPVHSQVTFCAMGDIPYLPAEDVLLPKQIADLPQDAEFAVHVGDIKNGKTPCQEAVYSKVAGMLSKAKPPVFIIPGDNEWNDCTDISPDQAWEYWRKYFMRFDRRWNHELPVYRQLEREENFSFVKNGVLFVGLNIVGGRVHDADQWKQRHAECLTWVRRNVRQFGDRVSSLVIFGHAKPAEVHMDFFDPFTPVAQQFGKPILFLHGDGHRWIHDYPFAAKNILRVQVDQGGIAPPLKVSVTDDPTNPFVFDRRSNNLAEPVNKQ